MRDPVRRLLLALSVVAPMASASSPDAAPAAAEEICLKSHKQVSLEGLAIACYSDRGCAFVEERKGEPLADYDEASVASALGREKIEGIITDNVPIMKEIAGYGYTCVPLP